LQSGRVTKSINEAGSDDGVNLVRVKRTHVIITECCLEQAHPCARISSVRRVLDVFVAFVQEEVGLREAKQHNDVDYGEGKHVSRNHRINHRNEGSSQPDGTLWKLKINRFQHFKIRCRYI